MSHDVTNFLPPERRHSFTHNYFIRLATLAVVLATIMVGIHAALFAPTFLYVSNIHARAVAELAALSQKGMGGEADDSTVRVQSLEKDATRLVAYGTAPSASGILQKLFAVPHAHVSLQSISVDIAREGTTQTRMRISGVASSREGLRAYHSALSVLPFVVSADLPLSVYAKETDIAFTIDIASTLTP